MYNRVILLGEVGPKGVEIRPQREGSMMATFMLRTTETHHQSGREFFSWHVIECYGRAMQSAESLEPGHVVLVEGSLRRRSVGERWETIVVAAVVHRVMRAVLAE